MTKRLSLILLLVSNAHPLMATELRGEPEALSQYLLDQKKIIALQGTGEEKVEADIAITTLIVKTEDDSLARALDMNNGIRKNIKNRLTDAGIPATNIKSSRFSSTPNYGWFKDKPSSYEISHEVKISISDETQLRVIAQIVDRQKDVFIGATKFEDSAKGKNELKAVEKALNTIQSKKKLYEKNLGITLTPVKVIDQHVFAAPSPRPALRQKNERFTSSMPLYESETAPDSGAGADFGEITYTANTVVEFIIQP